MRIALVCPYDLNVPGGVQAQVVGLAEGLSGRGADIIVIAPGAAHSGPYESVSAGPSVRVPANGSRAPVCLDPRAWPRVRKAIDRADLIHAHEPLMPLVGWAALAGSKPKVLTFHADPPPMISALYRGIGRVGLKSATKVAVSEVAAAAVPWATTIIPNGLDTRFPDDEARLPNQVLFVGRDEPRKGLDVLLEAWSTVRALHPQAALIVAGGGDRNGPEGVSYVGRVDEAEKRRLLVMSSILVAPNLRGESFGIVVAEGMAAGCAVVASDIPAFRAVLGPAGRYAGSGAASDLAGAIVGLLEDPDLREQLGASARSAALSFDWAKVLDAYQGLYRKILGF